MHFATSSFLQLGRRNMDVLSIPSVLETVFKHLAVPAIGICRLVNKTWNLEACKLLKERVLITFDTYEDIQKFLNTFEKAIVDTSVIYERFYFPSDIFTSAIEDVAFGNLRRLNESLRRFVFLAGDQVTRLKLCVIPVLPVSNNAAAPYSNFMFTEMLEMVYNYFLNVRSLQILFIASTNVPQASCIDREDVYSIAMKDRLQKFGNVSLETLKNVQIEVDSSCVRIDEDTFTQIQAEMVTDFIKSLLQSAQHLNEITLNAEGKHSAHGDILVDCLAESVPSRIQSINAKLSLSPTICKLNLPNLNKIQVIVWALEVNSNPDLDLFKEFSKRFQSTLQILHLSYIAGEQLSSLCFPVVHSMKRLKALDLELYNGYINFDKLPVLNFLVLRKCSMKNVGVSMQQATKFHWSQLNRLEVSDGMLDSKEEFLRSLQETIPLCFNYLQTLVFKECRVELPLSTIFAHCSRLKILCIQKCGEVTDETLCGIRKALMAIACPVDVHSSNANMEQLNKLVAYARSEALLALRENSFIGKLTDLQSLTLEGDFSDVGVVYGISLCEKLLRIDLKSLKCTWRSSTVLKNSLSHLVSGRINAKRC